LIGEWPHKFSTFVAFSWVEEVKFLIFFIHITSNTAPTIRFIIIIINWLLVRFRVLGSLGWTETYLFIHIYTLLFLVSSGYLKLQTFIGDVMFREQTSTPWLIRHDQVRWVVQSLLWVAQTFQPHIIIFNRVEHLFYLGKTKESQFSFLSV
jgi:hypothetical protein